MSLAKDNLFALLPTLCERSFTLRTRPGRRSKAPFIVLTAIFLMLAAISAVPVMAQEIPASAKRASAPATPAGEKSQRPVSHPHRQVPQKSETKTEALPEATAAPTPATATSTAPVATTPPIGTPQAADDRLPFMTGNERDSREQPASATGLLLRTLGALLLIVGLIVAAAWGMKRFGGARFGTPQENAPALAVLNSLSLGERRSLTIVRFGDRTLLLGSTAHTVTLLAESDADEFTPPARSVADILNDEDPAAFAMELSSATAQLNEEQPPQRGTHFTA